MRNRLNWQFDWRGNQIQNLRILVDHRCMDEPQPQLRPIIVGPDPYPVRDPRPGFAASQMGGIPPPLSFVVPTLPPRYLFEQTDQGEVITDDQGNPIRIIPSPPDPGISFGLANNGGILQVTSPNYWPPNTVGTDHPGLASYGLAPGDLWSLGGFANVIPGNIPDPSAPPVLFGQINTFQLLLLGGKNLPFSDPLIGNALWNNNGVVNISSAFGAGLFNDGGFLQLLDPTGYSTSPAGLQPGDVWSNGQFVNVVPGGFGPEQVLMYGTASARELLFFGCGGIPTTDPLRSGQFWNNGDFVCVSLGA